MAQRVGYFQDNVVFKEGPFVMVNINGWRLEVEDPVHICPILPDPSIKGFLINEGFMVNCLKIDDEAKMACFVDFLNAKVREGVIKLEGNTWVWPLYKDVREYLRISGRLAMEALVDQYERTRR